MAIAIHLEGYFQCIVRGQKVFLVCPKGEEGGVELLIISGGGIWSDAALVVHVISLRWLTLSL